MMDWKLAGIDTATRRVSSLCLTQRLRSDGKTEAANGRKSVRPGPKTSDRVPRRADSVDRQLARAMPAFLRK